MKIIFLLFALVIFPMGGFAQSENVKKTYTDIEKTLGMVPTFMKQFPTEGIEGAWEDMKGVQLNPESAISPQYKELIGIAVASQIPCRYCAYFHTQAALMNGATQKQIDEAIALAGNTRKWSAVLNGNQIDFQAFKNDVDKIHQNMMKKKDMQAMEVKPAPVSEIKTAEDAYKDMQQMYGFVPIHFSNYPKNGVVGAWKEMKGLEMNKNSAIPSEYQHLISLAVASQVPCNYCTYYHTQSALMMNANKEQLQEAVAMAGIVRQWSTVLNGHDTNEKKFRGEVDKIMKFVKSKTPKEVTSN